MIVRWDDTSAQPALNIADALFTERRQLQTNSALIPPSMQKLYRSRRPRSLTNLLLRSIKRNLQPVLQCSCGLRRIIWLIFQSVFCGAELRHLRVTRIWVLSGHSGVTTTTQRRRNYDQGRQGTTHLHVNCLHVAELQKHILSS